LLARLPYPRRSLLADIEDAVPLRPDVGYPLHLYRDAAADLHNMVAPQAGPPLVLDYAVTLASRYAHRGGEAIREWTLLTGGRMGQNEVVLRKPRARADRSLSAAVLVQLDEATESKRYLLSIWRFPSLGDPAPVGHFPVPLTVEDAETAIKEALPEQIALLETSHREIVVEFVLPTDLHELAVEDWQPWQGKRRNSRLGRKHAVVIRDLDRLHDRDLAGAWRRRWADVPVQDIEEALQWLPCTVAGVFDTVEGRLESELDQGAIAFAGGANREETVDAALACGIPIMAWWRGSCDCTRGAECIGRRRYEHLLRETAGRALSQLPEAVRRLRADGAGTDARAVHSGRDIVLVFDNPERRPPRRLMVMPGSTGDG
jgi:hypothetical protein